MQGLWNFPDKKVKEIPKKICEMEIVGRRQIRMLFILIAILHSENS